MIRNGYLYRSTCTPITLDQIRDIDFLVTQWEQYRIFARDHKTSAIGKSDWQALAVGGLPLRQLGKATARTGSIKRNDVVGIIIS